MATKTESLFSLQYEVLVHIAATPEKVWQKLTDAQGFASWNSTVTSIEGDIALGNKLKIRVPVDPKRVFTPKVVEFVANERMVWQDGFFPMFQGRRTFSLTPDGEGTTFEMKEVFRGAMLPMIKGALPDFVPIFDRYGADLQKACSQDR